MITTSEIAPSPALAPFVRCYAYREFDTHGSDITKPWYASHEMYIPFFFKALPVKLVDPATEIILKTGKECDVVGISSKYNGEMFFNGSYAFFQIIFRPNGFNKIFSIPSLEVVDKIVSVEDVFDSEIKLLYEQLANAGSLNKMAALENLYLIRHLNKQKQVLYKDGITATAQLITSTKGMVNIDALACYANMSRRNFERLFNEAVGLSPKLLCCITRINHALALKLKFPNIDWTSITFQSGYFDQTHLTKDFKKFCGDTPSLQYRLLTEAEWEYAAHAGTTNAYYWGDSASHEYANYGVDSGHSALALGRDQWLFTSPVGSFPPNGFGLCDMIGNVMQWLEDCFSPTYPGLPADGSAYKESVQLKLSDALAGMNGTNSCAYRLCRGGDFGDPPGFMRSAFRNWAPSQGLSLENYGSSGLGFCVARTL